MATILLSTINARYIHASLGLRCLLANLGEFKAQSAIMEFALEDRPEDIAERLLAQKPSIIGLGVYIWNASQTAALLRLLKMLAPEIHVVIGGPEASHRPWRVNLSPADYCISGEGELAFYALCTELLRGRQPEKRFITAQAPELHHLQLPYDFYSKDDLAHRLCYVEASRGCPFGCEFCLSSLDKRVRHVPGDHFLTALESLWQRGARTFKFVDRSFNTAEHQALAILDFFLAKEPPYHAHFEVIPEHFSAAMKERLCAFPPGTLQLEIGIQTLQQEVATAIGRRFNLGKIKENISFLNKETKAHLHLDLIIGLPGETMAAFGEDLNQLMSFAQGEIQLGILKKLSGTSISRHDKQFGMVYNPNPPYDLLANACLSFMQLQSLKRMARYWDLCHNSGNFRNTLPLLWRNQDVFHSFFHFSQWLHEETEATWKIALPRLAEFLFRYLVEKQGASAQETANSLAADILTVKGRVLPPLVREQVTCLPKRAMPLTRTLTRRQDRHDLPTEDT